MKDKQGFKGFNPEHPLTSILESMMEREHPNYKNEPDIKWNFTKFLIGQLECDKVNMYYERIIGQ